MNVRDLMSPVPAVCTATDHLSRAAQIMWERDCGCVPVLDSAGGLTGIVTDRDVCMAAYTQGRPLHEIPVAEVMSRQLYTTGPDSRLDDALETMARRQVRRLPVVDAEQRLVGMLSVADFARAGAGTSRRRPKAEAILALFARISAERDLGRVAAPPASAKAGTSKGLIVPAAPKKRAPATKSIKPAKRR